MSMKSRHNINSDYVQNKGVDRNELFSARLGMGNDGEVGATAIHRLVGCIIAESAESCVVYGMPRSVIEAGITTCEAPLEKIPGIIASFLKTL